MRAKILFDFHFMADLDSYYVELLHEATGMRIGDVDNLWKDTPGRGEIVPGVDINLWRPSGEPNDWRLDASTREDGYDVAAVTACRERLLEVLPRISQSWEENVPPV